MATQLARSVDLAYNIWNAVAAKAAELPTKSIELGGICLHDASGADVSELHKIIDTQLAKETDDVVRSRALTLLRNSDNHVAGNFAPLTEYLKSHSLYSSVVSYLQDLNTSN